MSREELVMDMIGDLGDKYILEALPEHAGKPNDAQTDNVIHIKPAEANIEISKKDLRIYWITRALGMAAVVSLIVGAVVLLVQNWDKIAIKNPDKPGMVTTVIEPYVTSDSAITELITTEPGNINYDPAFDLLGKAYFDTDGAFRISDTEWTELQDCDIFKEYFYGIWGKGDREVVFDDSEKSEFAMLAKNCFLKGFYRSGESTLIFCMGGSAESSIWWLDMNAPDTLYWAGGSPGEFPNGIYLYDEIPNIAMYSKTDKAINEPKNGYLSVIRQRETAAEYGIPLELITDIEAEYNNITINHDAKYYAYPVYLISESDDKIVLRTTLGKMYDAIGNVTYSIEKNENGEWIQKIDSITSAADNPAHVRKTFDIEYYNPDDLPGMAAGGGLPFDGIVADGVAFKSIKPQGAPTSYSYRTDNFFADYRTDNFFADRDSIAYEIIPDDLMDILKEYSDGGSLKYDLGGELPALSSYTMLDDTDLLEEYGTKAYRVSNDYLVSVSQNMGNSKYYVSFYRRSEEYTEIRRIIELLWNKHDSSDPFNVFSVQSAGGENEGLMIVADDSLSMPGEQIDVLAQIKQLLAENGLPDKTRVEFVTPEQLRSEWVPVALCYNDGTPVDLSKFPMFVKYGGDMFLKVDGWFSTPNEVADKLDELGKTNAAKAMRGEIGIDNIGNKTKAETELFDLIPLDPSIMGGYGLLGNDVLIRQNIAGYDIYLYEPRFSSAVGAVTLLRAALTSYFEGRYRLELCIYGDPRLDLDDAKYTVKIYADRENWDDIKTFLETGSNDSVVWQFEDYQ